MVKVILIIPYHDNCHCFLAQLKIKLGDKKETSCAHLQTLGKSKFRLAT